MFKKVTLYFSLFSYIIQSHWIQQIKSFLGLLGQPAHWKSQYIVNLKLEANIKFLIGVIKLRQNPLSKYDRCTLFLSFFPLYCGNKFPIALSQDMLHTAKDTMERGGKGGGGLKKHCHDSFCPNVPKSIYLAGGSDPTNVLGVRWQYWF